MSLLLSQSLSTPTLTRNFPEQHPLSFEYY